MTTVVGLDAAGKGWIAVEAVDGRLSAYRFHATLRDALDAAPDAACFAIDIPIGHEESAEGRRAADVAARAFVGPERAASVFLAPPPALLRFDTREEAAAEAERRGWPKPTAQAWALRARMLEAEAVAGEDPRVHEIHPEVSFRLLRETLGKEGPLAYGKHSWAGLHERLELLHAVGLRPSRSFGGAGKVGPDDVLDATVAAWSGGRIVAGAATAMPTAPPRDRRTGRAVAIHG